MVQLLRAFAVGADIPALPQRVEVRAALAQELEALHHRGDVSGALNSPPQKVNLALALLKDGAPTELF